MALTTSTDYIRLGINCVTDYGLDFDRICRRAGIDTAGFRKSGARVSFLEILELWELIEGISMDENFGLHVGEKMVGFSNHILFLLLSQAPTLQAVIALLCRYWSLLTDIHSPRFRVKNMQAELSIDYHTEGLSMSRHSNEAVLALYALILQRLFEKKLLFKGVYFSHPKPKDISEHQRIFNAPLFFKQATNKLVFNREYLELPAMSSNRNLCRNLESIASDLLGDRYGNGFWSDQVRKEIYDALGNRKNSIETVADGLGITPRNLQYKLKNEGSTYQEILDQIRKEKAVYLLKHVSLTISDTASLLGFSEQSAFSRAFKRWYGLSPRNYLVQTGSRNLTIRHDINSEVFDLISNI